MFSPDTCEGKPEHPELVDLSSIEKKKAEISEGWKSKMYLRCKCKAPTENMTTESSDSVPEGSLQKKLRETIYKTMECRTGGNI